MGDGYTAGTDSQTGMPDLMLDKKGYLSDEI
uniref:Uncharacterized protein n=1 Tax=Anguilla anguilla TaxID=7936 RepID=A0A0E9PRX4_ANGAN